MAKYAISKEGAEAMSALAKGLLINANDIINTSQVLNQKIAVLNDGLGTYANEINELINRNLSTLQKNRADIIGLANKIKTKANEISELVNMGLTDKQTGTNTSPSGQNNAAIDSLAPNRSTPRNLTISRYGFVQDDDGNLVYDSPIETNDYLYTSQGSADQNYQGTCGLCSCVNILRLAGVYISEKDLIDYASNTNGSFFGKLCSTGYSQSDMNGRTNPNERQMILEHYGIDSGIIPLKKGADGYIDHNAIMQIADGVSSGKGVIISVHADMLWYDAQNGVDDAHAVTVTSVKKNNKGEILGFYICDSNKGGTTYYTADKIRRCLTGNPMNITYSIIR